MGLARAWRRRLYASVGLAVLVPAALMISLALLAVGGGSLSLTSLKQLVSGPSAPLGQPVALGAPGGRALGGHRPNVPAGGTLLASVTRPSGSTHSSGPGAGPLHHGSGGSP